VLLFRWLISYNRSCSQISYESAIDGEDLASLIKRIGHLTKEKALDIARQLAAGLAAAHERGVLHRDLKPANIMLDGHGRVRITDFGLAIAQGDETQTAEIAGTPAYMAPEQLAGKGATVRSDIYSLGLVLYELCTGKKAFPATTLAELREQKETYTPRSISEIHAGMDPVVERLIRRCMEKEPNARPTSAAQLALALPGGDPLAAALAAGETPSPEMVAASGSKEGLRPAVAVSLLAFIIVGMIAVIAINDRLSSERRIPIEKRPEELVERSHNILRKMGYTEKFADSAFGFMANYELLDYIEQSDRTADRWKKLNAQAVLFWYRQSPRPLGVFGLTHGSTGPNNPPLEYPGEILVMLDTDGRLVSLRTEPVQVESSVGTASTPDWQAMFSEAGLDPSLWKPVKPQLMPHSFAETRAAWEGRLLSFQTAPIRIEASALQGKPVNFEIVGPWTRTSLSDTPQTATREGPVVVIILIMAILITVPSIFFARKNLKLGRGDRRNANRIALFSISVSLLVWALGFPRNSFFGLLLIPYMPITMWIFYIAMEPFARRWWPRILVSWTRLLSGEWRDSLVGRDMLVGAAIGVAICVLGRGLELCYALFFRSFQSPLFVVPLPGNIFSGLEYVTSARSTITALLDELNWQIWLDLALTIWLLVILRFLLRSQKAAIALSVLFVALIGSNAGFAMGLIFGALLFFALMRFGFLAALLCGFIHIIFLDIPLTLHASAWYAVYGYLALALLAAIVLYAFRTSLGGRALIAPSRFDD
jgi:hypothetical protein